MFGITKNKIDKFQSIGVKNSCGNNHYCGNCKTIGRQYSQKSRVLLNSDTVFLSELLFNSNLDEYNHESFDISFMSRSCFSLPGMKIPLPYVYAAAINILFVKIKIDDNIIDSQQSFFWKIISKSFKKEFKISNSKLAELSFPLDDFQKLIRLHFIREEEVLMSQNFGMEPNQLLDYIIEPIAKATSMVYGFGSTIINKPELEDIFEEIGASFGKLVFILDAYKDYQSDNKKSKFNAIKIAYNLNGLTIDNHIDRLINVKIDDLISNISNAICKLPIPNIKLFSFINTLKPSITHSTNQMVDNSESKSHSKNRFVIAHSYIQSFFGEEKKYFKVGSLAFMSMIVFFLIMPNSSYAQNAISSFFSDSKAMLPNHIERVPICCAPCLCCAGYCCEDKCS